MKYVAYTSGKDKIGLLATISKRIRANGGSIIKCASNTFSGTVSLIIEFSASEIDFEKLQEALNHSFKENFDLPLWVAKVDHESEGKLFGVHIGTPDTPGVVNVLTTFFTDNGLSIVGFHGEEVPTIANSPINYSQRYLVTWVAESGGDWARVQNELQEVVNEVNGVLFGTFANVTSMFHGWNM